MGSENHALHILFFPFMAPGHMNPMVDMAKLFTRRGVKATILTTPANAPLIQPSIDRANKSNHDHHHYPISVELVPFPSTEAGLPAGCENFSSLPSPDLISNYFHAVSLLRQPFDRILTELAPDCVVTDFFLPWTCTVAAEHGVPRLTFNGMSLFTLCAGDSLGRHKTLETLPKDAPSFVFPGLPHRIEMLRTQLPDRTKTDPSFSEMIGQANVADTRSYGVVVNSFCELEPGYAEHFRNVVGRKAWYVGPLSLCNEDEPSVHCDDPCLKWLDNKTPGSVVYVAFGSMSVFTAAQLREMAVGIEAADHPFIWAVRDCGEDWMPEGYEERIEGKGGLIIRGWAPQVLILNHPAVGGFVTHCGWNSSLEAVSAGVPLVTWPLFAEQFFNERLIINVIGIGVSIGVKEFVERQEERAVVAAAEIEKAVCELMGGGEEAERRRQRARELQQKAKRAVEDGGSSYVDMGNLINELSYKFDACS